jgi:hypothetical protein
VVSLKPVILCAVIFLSCFAPGCALLQLLPRGTFKGKTGLAEGFIASTVISFSIFVTPQVVFGWVFQLSIVSIWNKLYIAMALLSTVFLAFRFLHRVNRKCLKAIWQDTQAKDKLVALAVCGAIVTYVIVLAIAPPYLDYNAINYYVRDALTYFRTSSLPPFVPAPLGLPGTYPMTVPPLISLCFTYLFIVENILFQSITFKILTAFSIEFIVCIVVVSLLLFRIARISRDTMYIAILILLSYPLVYLYMFFSPMGMDLPFGFFCLGAVYFTVGALTIPAHRVARTALAALSCGLAATTKIEYPLIFLWIGLIVVFYVVRRPILRFVVAVVGVIGQVVVFRLLTPDLLASVGSLPFFLAVIICGLFFALLYGHDVTPRLPIKCATALKLSGVFLVLVMVNVIYLYRGYVLTGSPMGFYGGQSLHLETPNYEWAESIDQVRYLDRAWRAGSGVRPGLPQKNYLVPILGFEWDPVLLPFLFLGLSTLLTGQASAESRLLGALVLATFLTWWLVFGQDHTRQLLVISPFIALLQAVGIATLWKIVSPSFLAKWVYTVLLLLLGGPFSVSAFSYYRIIFRAPFSLTSWRGVGYYGYYDQENLLDVLRFVVKTSCVTLILLPFRSEVVKLLSWKMLLRLKYVLTVVVMLALWLMQASPLLVVLTDYGTVANYQQVITDEMVYGFIPAVRHVESLYPEISDPGTIVTIYLHNVEVITNYRFRRYNIMERVANGYYRDLLTNTNMTEVLEAMREEQMVAAILPAPENPYYNSLILTKYGPDNLPFYWLISDSGIFSSAHIGKWIVLDIGHGPNIFDGFVAVLVETENGRGRLFNRSEFRMDPNQLGQELRIVPVIDVSGQARKFNRLPDDFRARIELAYRIFSGSNALSRLNPPLAEGQMSIEGTDTFYMPVFDLTEVVRQVPTQANNEENVLVFQIVRIVCDVEMDDVSFSRFQVVPRAEAPTFLYNTSSRNWQFVSQSGVLIPSEVLQ